MWTTRYEDEKWTLIDVVAGTSKDEVIVLTDEEVAQYEQDIELKREEKSDF
jgi:hypothetical protein